MFPEVNVISFSSLLQQVLMFSPLLDQVTEKHAIYSKWYDLILKKEILNLVLVLNYSYHFLLLHKNQPVLLKLINPDHYMFYRKLSALQ